MGSEQVLIGGFFFQGSCFSFPVRGWSCRVPGLLWNLLHNKTKRQTVCPKWCPWIHFTMSRQLRWDKTSNKNKVTLVPFLCWCPGGSRTPAYQCLTMRSLSQLPVRTLWTEALSIVCCQSLEKPSFCHEDRKICWFTCEDYRVTCVSFKLQEHSN